MSRYQSQPRPHDSGAHENLVVEVKGHDGGAPNYGAPNQSFAMDTPAKMLIPLINAGVEQTRRAIRPRVGSLHVILFV